MPRRVSNLRLPPECNEAELPPRALSLLGLPLDHLARWRILRKSLDLRDKSRIEFVYTLELDVHDLPRRPLVGRGLRVKPYAEPPFALPSPGSLPLGNRTPSRFLTALVACVRAGRLTSAPKRGGAWRG